MYVSLSSSGKSCCSKRKFRGCICFRKEWRQQHPINTLVYSIHTMCCWPSCFMFELYCICITISGMWLMRLLVLSWSGMHNTTCSSFASWIPPPPFYFQVEVVSVDLKAQCNSDSTVFKASQSDITKDSSPVVTENEITLSFEVKRLRYLTPEFIDFPALDPTRKQTQQDMVPTSSTPLVSTRYVLCNYGRLRLAAPVLFKFTAC